MTLVSVCASEKEDPKKDQKTLSPKPVQFTVTEQWILVSRLSPTTDISSSLKPPTGTGTEQ